MCIRDRRMMKGKVRKNLTVFENGDRIYWRDTKDIKRWRQGKVIAADGTLLFVRDGGELYRVNADMAVKVNEEYDKNGGVVDKQQAQIVENIRRQGIVRQRRVSVQSIDPDSENEEAGDRDGAEGRPGAGPGGGPGSQIFNIGKSIFGKWLCPNLP